MVRQRSRPAPPPATSPSGGEVERAGRLGGHCSPFRHTTRHCIHVTYAVPKAGRKVHVAEGGGQRARHPPAQLLLLLLCCVSQVRPLGQAPPPPPQQPFQPNVPAGQTCRCRQQGKGWVGLSKNALGVGGHNLRHQPAQGARRHGSVGLPAFAHPHEQTDHTAAHTARLSSTVAAMDMQQQG